jgi:hypothetical protein
VTAELNVHLEDPVGTKTGRCELHKSDIHGWAAITKLLITERITQMRKRWCHDHKIGTSGNWKNACDMVRRVVFHTAPYIRRKCLRLENTQGSLQSGMHSSNSETRGKFCDGLDSNIIVQCPVGPIITLHGRITARE